MFQTRNSPVGGVFAQAVARCFVAAALASSVFTRQQSIDHRSGSRRLCMEVLSRTFVLLSPLFVNCQKSARALLLAEGTRLRGRHSTRERRRGGVCAERRVRPPRQSSLHGAFSHFQSKFAHAERRKPSSAASPAPSSRDHRTVCADLKAGSARDNLVCASSVLVFEVPFCQRRFLYCRNWVPSANP